MFKKVLLLVSLSTFSLFALDTGDKLPSDTVEILKLKEDKVYIIDFFASWCKSCKKELPLISKLNGQIDAQKTEIIGVDVDEDVEEGKAFQKELALTFKVIDDSDNTLIKTFDPVGMPSIFIVKNGEIIGTLIGAKEQIDKQILRGLKGLK